MPVGILRFKLPEEEEGFFLAQKAISLQVAITDVGNLVFRPARKHGYGDTEIKELVEKIGPDAVTLVGLLEDKFYEILRDNEVNG